jgi:uncharacterized protein
VDDVVYTVRSGKAEWNGKTLSEWVPELTRTIVDAFDPEKIVLFGSVVAGTDGPDSDIDVLVVFDELPLSERRKRMVELRRATRDVAVPCDLLATSRSDFERHRDVPGTMEYEPAQHGRVVHERRAA